jgi:hypothetical protein
MHGLTNDATGSRGRSWPLRTGRRSERLVVLYGFFSSTKETNEWRFHRRETDPNL